MGYVPTHLFIVTGDKRFKVDYLKFQRQSIIGIIVSGSICLLALLVAFLYVILNLGG